MRMPNPLTDHEKAQLNRLHGHNSAASFMVLQNGFAAQYPAHQRNAIAILQTITDLSGQEIGPHTMVSGERGLEILKNGLAGLCTLHPNTISYVLNDSCAPLLSDRFSCPLFVTLSNLIDNSIKHSGCTKPTAIIVGPSSFPSDVVYVPEGARDYSRFVAFRVRDGGNGFPRGADLSKYLTTCPPSGGHGLGLYLTGLAAKALRAPVGISSVPGNTIVSFYHPIVGEIVK